jgi:hypothetical protein
LRSRRELVGASRSGARARAAPAAGTTASTFPPSGSAGPGSSALASGRRGHTAFGREVSRSQRLPSRSSTRPPIGVELGGYLERRLRRRREPQRVGSKAPATDRREGEP